MKPRRCTCSTRRGAISRYAERAVALLGHARPRAEVHLVDRPSGSRVEVARRARAFIHASSPQAYVLDATTREAVPGGRSIARRERIGLRRGASPSRRQDLELVERARRDARARTARRRPTPPSWRIGKQPAVPAAEVADDADTRCAFGAQTANATPSTPSIVARVRAEHLPQAAVRALAEQVQVDVAERRQEAIRIVALPGRRRRRSGSAAGSRAAARARAGTRRRAPSPERRAADRGAARAQRPRTPTASGWNARTTTPRDARRRSPDARRARRAGSCARRVDERAASRRHAGAGCVRLASSPILVAQQHERVRRAGSRRSGFAVRVPRPRRCCTSSCQSPGAARRGSVNVRGRVAAVQQQQQRSPATGRPRSSTRRSPRRGSACRALAADRCQSLGVISPPSGRSHVHVLRRRARTRRRRGRSRAAGAPGSCGAMREAPRA